MSYDHWKTTNPDDEFLGPDPEDHDDGEPSYDTMKRFASINGPNGRLVSVSLSYEYPPIPIRNYDWCAWFSNDECEQPDYGWGATPDDAIQDLTDNCDYEDTLPSFTEMYMLDLLYARLHWQGIERNYTQIS